MIDISAPCNDLVAEVTAHVHEGETSILRGFHIGLHVTRIAGQILDGVDDENREQELPQLEQQIESAAQKLAAIGNGGLYVAAALRGLLPMIVPAVAEKAAERSEALVALRDNVVVPGLRKVRDGAAKFLSAIAPDATE